jgi:hypothetical protein
MTYYDNKEVKENLNNYRGDIYLNTERNIHNNYKIDKLYDISNEATYKSNNHQLDEKPYKNDNMIESYKKIPPPPPKNDPYSEGEYEEDRIPGK